MDSRLKQIREKMNLSQDKMSELAGVNKTIYCAFELGKMSPIAKNGDTYLKESATTLCENLGLLPEKVWPKVYPETVEYEEIPTTIYNPEEKTTDILLHESVQYVLGKITPREATILCMRFGINLPNYLIPEEGLDDSDKWLLDGRQCTLEEVSTSFFVTKERIRQTEAKSLRKLRHPSRSKYLYYQDWKIDEKFLTNKSKYRHKTDAEKAEDAIKLLKRKAEAKEREEKRQAERALAEEFAEYQRKLHDYQCTMYIEGKVRRTVTRGIALANTMGALFDSQLCYSILWDAFDKEDTGEIIKKAIKRTIKKTEFGKFQYYLMETYEDDLWRYLGRPLSILRITEDYVALQPIKSHKVIRLRPHQREFYLLFKGKPEDPNTTQYW